MDEEAINILTASK